MVRFFSSRGFLAAYSAVLTIVFAGTVLLGARSSARSAEFDQITVHRINVVEPDGTPRLIVSNKAAFPGLILHGKDIPRADRATAGMIFLNDEGTENGGLIFGGSKDSKGVAQGYGHLSFDRYDQDQVINIEQDEDGDQRNSGIAINDQGEYRVTPEFVRQASEIKAMPAGPAKAQAWKSFLEKYPNGLRRAYLGRRLDKTVGLTLNDTAGRERLRLVVKKDGAPAIEFLDARGKVVKEYTATQ